MTRPPEWGPGGMQPRSEPRPGRLVIRGCPGNSARDPIDHRRGMPTFIELLR